MTGRGGFSGFAGQDGPDHLRVGDAERDEVAVALHDHFAQGRLNREELDERLEATLGAKTAGDLREVTRDLPGPHAGSARREGATGARTGDRPHGVPHPGAPHDAGWWHGGPPWLGHHHAGRARLAPLLIGLFLVTAIVAGTAWAFAVLVKVVLLGWLILAVTGLLSHRRGHRLHGHRGPHALR